MDWLKTHLAGLVQWLVRMMAEDDAGAVPSSSRTIAIMLAIAACSLVGVIDFAIIYATLHGRSADATMLAAVAGAIAPTLGGLAYVMGKRGGQ